MPSIPSSLSRSTSASAISKLSSLTAEGKDVFTFDRMFPFYLVVTFFGLFVIFGGLRCMIDGSDDIIAHDPTGALNMFSWFWGMLCGFMRINPASGVMLSTCVVSMSLWSKHRAMALAACGGDSRSRLSNDVRKIKSTTAIEIPQGDSGNGKSISPRTASTSNLPHVAEQPKKHRHSSEGSAPRGFVDRWYYSLPKLAILQALFVVSLVLVFGMTCQIAPSWGWHLSALFFYNVPKMDDVVKAVDGICPSYGGDMCLSDDSWLLLSNNLLSRHKLSDVEAVAKGVNVAQNGGLIINVMARDTVNAIPALIKNVEALSPFFRGKLSVVMYENDSVDGTREAIKNWAATASGYKVDLMTCEEQGDVDCKLQQVHRYDQNGEFISAVGRMAEYRNQVQEYITKNYSTKEYSHMMITDIDLAISLAPLGLIHTLGTVGEHAPVAARGIMMLPGSLGTLYMPYDYSAFRPVVNEDNKYLRSWHDWFCELAPAGSRWRNNCDVMSPFNMMHVLALDTEFVADAYPVASAFHGATLYPFKQIVATDPKYDDGEDGQRCEHIGFNFALTDSDNWEQTPDTANFATHMYIAPKWTMHLDPTRPGGPTGWRFAGLLLTQGINSQCIIMFSTVFFWNFVVSAGVALAIMAILRGWGKCARTPIFRKWAAVAGVNVADVLPGGLMGGNARKNTADDEGILLLALAASNEESDDEEVGFLRKDVKNL